MFKGQQAICYGNKLVVKKFGTFISQQIILISFYFCQV